MHTPKITAAGPGETWDRGRMGLFPAELPGVRRESLALSGDGSPW